MAAEIANQERTKTELEDLRIELAQEEQESLARRKEFELLQHRIKMRLETIDAYQAQVADKKKRLAEDKLEEEIYREKVSFANSANEKVRRR